MITLDETLEFEHVIDRLAEQFSEQPRQIIAGVVAEEYARLEGCAVRAYVSVLVQRASRDRLSGRRRRAVDLAQRVSRQD